MMTEWGRKFPESKVKATKGEGHSESLATVEIWRDQKRTVVMIKSITGQSIVIGCGIAI
jgi:hypothetical protein